MATEQTEPAPETKSPPASARQLLVQWANEQDGWVRQLVSEILSSPEGLSPDVLDVVFDRYMKEKGLEDGEASPVDQLELDQPEGSKAADFVINSLSDISGVNALVADQEIEFNKRLTILFGENGSGKTGYTRILKRIGAVRTAEPILPNVHKPTAANQKPHAVINYTLEGKREPLDWNGEEGLSPFTHLSIFDTPAVRLHLDEDLSYIYTPGDLALFPRVTDGISAVRAKLEAAITKRRPASNPYLTQFTKGTPVYAIIESLSAATDLVKVKELADIGEADEKQLETLTTQLTALQGQAVAAQLAVARARRELNADLVEAAKAIQDFDDKAYNEAVAKAKKADGEYAKLRKELRSAAGLEENGEAEWQAFVLSGEDYRKHVESREYPQRGDACLYCRQPLEQNAVALLRRYEKFANDASRQRAVDSRDLAATLARNVTALNQAALSDSLTQAQANDKEDAALGDAIRMVDALAVQQQILKQGEAVDWRDIRNVAEKLKKESEARRDAAEKLIKSLTEKEDKRAESLRKVTAEHAALKDRIELAQRLSEVSAYVEDAQWTHQASELQKRFTSLLRSLTETSKTASEQLMNSDFANRFKAESEALRAPAVSLEFPGREGKAARRKTVSASHRPSEILSEGEQKVIALADFLAEAGLRLTPAPLVLDDPVSSLDYRRIQEVADRVAELTGSRQVIVFTHNIWFATELLSRFEKRQGECSYFSVTEDESGKGVITKGSHPRWDTIKKTRGKLNDAINSADASDGEAREALVERGYSLIRTWCEVVVETELLAGVTMRYEPNIGMTKLPQIRGDRLQAAVEVILPIFEKACRVTEGHSQPLETLSVRPSLDDLKKDWKDLQEALKRYNLQ